MVNRLCEDGAAGGAALFYRGHTGPEVKDVPLGSDSRNLALVITALSLLLSKKQEGRFLTQN